MVGQARTIEDRDVPLARRALPLRELLATLVAHELDGFDARQRENSLLRVLSPTDLARGADTGRYAAEPRPPQQAPPLSDAVQRAEEAFADGLFFVFVDGRQVESLDEPVTVAADSRVRLVRLVALAGG